MTADEALVIANQILGRNLNPTQSSVFQQSWQGKPYAEIAQDTAYGYDYVKEIGSQLWNDLSTALGEKVTKKNLQLALGKYQSQREAKRPSSSPPSQESIPLEHTRNSQATVQPELEFPSGPVPLNSPFYIERPPLEELARTEIRQPGSVTRIQAPRKMGKSSLLNRTIACATEWGYKTVHLDFQVADQEIFTSLNRFLRWFCLNISRQLHLPPNLDDYWDEEMGSKMSCTVYFEYHLLEQTEAPLVLALNEVNRVFEHPNIAQDLLPLLRFWHEQAKRIEIWQRLRLIVVHSTEIYIPLKIDQSPFNVGQAIKLPEWTPAQVQDLALRHGLTWAAGDEGAQHLTPLLDMVGGHPYLIRLAFYHLCRQHMSLSQLLENAHTLDGIFGDHLRSHLLILQENPELTAALQKVVLAQEGVPLEPTLAYKLSSMGLAIVEGQHCTLSCQLYRRYFEEHSF